MSSTQTQTSKTQREVDQSKPCFNFFKFGTKGETEKGEASCSMGAKCRFSHKVEVYMKTNDLKKCPTCVKFCKSSSKQCKTCVEKWLDQKDEATLRRKVEEKARYQEAKQKEWLKKQDEKQKQWQQWQDEVNSRPEQQCRGGKKYRDQDRNVIVKGDSGYECPEMTKFDLCKECYETAKQYTAPRSSTVAWKVINSK
jgi:hypothetical protein